MDKCLINKFEMKDPSACKKILGMEIHRDRRTGEFHLSQKKYLEKVLDRFNMSDCKSVSTPLVAHFKLSFDSCPKIEEEIEKMSDVLYSSAVGSLMYAVVCIRPDLSFVVSAMSFFMHNPSKDHWDAVKWILRYMRGSLNKYLVFDKSKSIILNAIV